MGIPRTLFMVGVVAWALAACSSDPAPTEQAPSEPARAPVAAVVPSPTEIEVVEEYRYDPTGKPDPFRSFVRLEQPLDTDPLATPLERFDLTQLEVTAIVWGTDEPRALVTDPSGKGYIVSKGTPIGKNKGRIVDIDDNIVRVKETYVDFRDRATTKEVEMRLYESQGG